jgi:hypothetical protein
MSIEQTHRRPLRRLRAALSTIAVVAATAVVIVAALVVWTLSRSYFVGAQSDGHVAVYQGLPWNVVGNVRLYRAVYVSPVLTAQLSQSERHKLFDHSLRSESSARAEVRNYEDQIGAGSP